MSCYLDSNRKSACFGCEACVGACGFGAIGMARDDEGFAYPVVDNDACCGCGACRRVCPSERLPEFHGAPVFVFGGHNKDDAVLEESTSGGAFSAIVEAWFAGGGNRVACGAVAHGLEVRHEFAESADEAVKFRKSKYVQSSMGDVYRETRKRLRQGIGVLFSGTPCQIAGLKAYLGNVDAEGSLLTVEVICEGVPSPLYIEKLAEAIERKCGSAVRELDYRYKDGKRWDFQVMRASLENAHDFKVDRWFNPFWSVWLQHLMSRPSCYECPFARAERVADITLGDLWGVHLYCPDLYNGNAGASLVVCNSAFGYRSFGVALGYMRGHELEFGDALRFQGPMRNSILANPARESFMSDLRKMGYAELNEKWGKKPTPGLLFRKYVWGNRQKVAMWNIGRRLFGCGANGGCGRPPL